MSSRLKGDFRKFMDKNFLGSWDVPEGEDLTLTIDHCEQNEVKNERGAEQKLVMYFKESGFKPMILNTVNSEAISEAYGSKRVEDWEGKRISITTERVKAFGSMKDALRIRPYKPKITEEVCDECGQMISRHGEYSVNKIVMMTQAKYNRKLCWDCAMKAKEANNG